MLLFIEQEWVRHIVRRPQNLSVGTALNDLFPWTPQLLTLRGPLAWLGYVEKAGEGPVCGRWATDHRGPAGNSQEKDCTLAAETERPLVDFDLDPNSPSWVLQ